MDAVSQAGARNICPVLVACGNTEYGDVAECERRWFEETVSVLSDEQAARPSCAREHLEYYRCLMTRPYQCREQSSLRIAPTNVDECDAVSMRLDDCSQPPAEVDEEEEFEDEDDSETSDF